MDKANKRLEFVLNRVKALKRVRELHELAKSRVDPKARERVYTILRLNESEKNEYIYLVDKFML